MTTKRDDDPMYVLAQSSLMWLMGLAKQRTSILRGAKRCRDLCRAERARADAAERERDEAREKLQKAWLSLESECQTCEDTGVMYVSDDGEGLNEQAVECGECGGTGRGYIAEWKDKHRAHLALTRRRALLLGADRREWRKRAWSFSALDTTLGQAVKDRNGLALRLSTLARDADARCVALEREVERLRSLTPKPAPGTQHCLTCGMWCEMDSRCTYWSRTAYAGETCSDWTRRARDQSHDDDGRR